MTDLNAMWTRLAEHQPFADQRGYGAEWREMCAERTPDAADAAAWVAQRCASGDAADAASTAWAAMLTANASAAWAAEAWAAEAIESINKSEASDEQN
jgi:hypothetical protein